MTHPIDEQIVGQHIGTFSVPKWMLTNHGQVLLDFFHKELLLPVRAELMFYDDSIEYTALGMNFEAVPMGRIPYHYVLDVECENVPDQDDPFKNSMIIKELKLRRFN